MVFPDGISFKCTGCGQCCKEQPADVTTEERKRIETRGFTNFLDETDVSEPRLILNRDSGGCFFLAKDNSCLIHDVKPAICQIVPFVVMDWDYENDVIEVDLPADCACPGIHEGNYIPVETIAKAVQTYVYSLQKSIADQECLPITDPKVLSKTRQIVIKLSTEEQI